MLLGAHLWDKVLSRAEKILSAKEVLAAKKPGRYADGAGLYLIVGDNQNKRWVLRIQVDGRRRDFGLGSLRKVSLAIAREKANELRTQCLNGLDPAIERKKLSRIKNSNPTFEEAARAFHAESRPTWKNGKHAAQVLATLATYAFPQIGQFPVREITEAQVRSVLIAIWLDKPETARRLRQRVSAVLDWARANGYRDTVLDLRTRSLALPRQTKAVEHHRAMPYAEVPSFLAAMSASQSSSITIQLALEFVILTAARLGEVRGAVWAEMDLHKCLWVIPAERMKAAREHRIPLSDRAVTILQVMVSHKSNHSDLVFPGSKPGRPISDMAITMLYRRLELDVTTHGFRSTFRDWCAEQTSFPREVAEAALAHQIGNKVERAYARSDLLDRRRELMAAWAAFCGCAN